MSDDDITAYHESGHAVMGIYLGGIVQSVSLAPESSIDWDDNFPRYGDTIIAWPTSSVTPRQHAEREVQTALAGPVSEMLYTGEEPGEMIHAESAADWYAASKHAATFIASQPKRTAYLVATLAELTDFFREETIWAAVGALADELQAHDVLESEAVHATVGFWLRRR